MNDPRYDLQLFTSKAHCLKQLLLVFLNDMDNLGLGPLRDIEYGINLRDEVRHFETTLIKLALLKTNGQQRRAAKLLGVKATTLNAKLKQYGLQPHDYQTETKVSSPSTPNYPKPLIGLEMVTDNATRLSID